MNARIYVFGVIVVTLAVSVLAAWQFQVHPPTVGSAFSDTLYGFNGVITLLAAPLFIFGLRRFTTEFRRTYRIFCFGVGLLGLSQLILFATSLTHLGRDQVAVLTSTPYILSFFLEFLGLRACAKVLKIKTGWSSLTRLLVAGATAALVAVLLPRVAAGTTAQVAGFTVGALAFMGSFSVFMASLAGRIRKSTGALYNRALSGLWISLTVFAVANIFILVDELWFGGETNQLVFGFGILLDSVASCFLLGAGYEHNVIGVDLAAQAHKADRVSSVDIVVYAAGLVSNRAEVDTILDTMRKITARLGDGHSMSSDDQHQLRETYLSLEAYLTTREPAQHFTVSDLRELVSSTLHLDARASGTFWPQLPPAQE